MTNRGTRVRSSKRPRLRYLSLAFETNSNTKENLENGKRPHGGIKGEKKHPLSPYSYNRDPQYHQELQEDIDKLFREEFIEQHGSPDWVLDANKDVTHTDESPLLVNKLLSSSKQSKNDEIYLENLSRLSGRRSAPPTRRSETSYYRPNSTHQYLSSTDTRNSVENGFDIRYGRPTRTTLLRARQRSNSTPINAYEARREATKRLESPSPVYGSREMINVTNPGESKHSFLTGARYNRAHYLDAKSLSVYGVYMPRHNPHACFVTGHAATRIKDGGEIPAAPPDSPRSDMDDLSLPLHLKRPATAPGKRLLISTAPPSGRPRSAWGDATTTCNITQNESENNENTENSNNKPVIEELIIIPDDLNVRGSRVVVTIKGSKSLSLSESKLPRVKGISVPRLTHNSARDPVDETSLVNQPPPTPVGGLSLNEEQSASMSVKHDSLKHDSDIEKGQHEECIEHRESTAEEQLSRQPVEFSDDKTPTKADDNNTSHDKNQSIIDIPTDMSLPKQESSEYLTDSANNEEKRVTWETQQSEDKINISKSEAEIDKTNKTDVQSDNKEIMPAKDTKDDSNTGNTFFITEENEQNSNADVTGQTNPHVETDATKGLPLKDSDVTCEENVNKEEMNTNSEDIIEKDDNTSTEKNVAHQSES